MTYCKVSLTFLILLNISFQQVLTAQPIPSHVIPVEELQHQLISRSTQRMENIREIQKLLHNDLVQQELGRLVDLERVELALTTLDDHALSELAAESREVNDQIEAGLTVWAWIGIAILAFIALIIIGLATTGLE